MLFKWVYKTSTISFPLQLIKPYTWTYSKTDKNQEPEITPACIEAFMERFVK